MKKKLCILSLSVLSILCLNFALPSKGSLDNKIIEVYFDNSLTIDDLVKTKNELIQQQIIVNYQVLEFDEAGKLMTIGFSVTSEGKYWGSCKTGDLNTKYGFIIDKNPDARYYFKGGVRKKD